jgi:hypothetical protein
MIGEFIPTLSHPTTQLLSYTTIPSSRHPSGTIMKILHASVIRLPIHLFIYSWAWKRSACVRITDGRNKSPLDLGCEVPYEAVSWDSSLRSLKDDRERRSFNLNMYIEFDIENRSAQCLLSTIDYRLSDPTIWVKLPSPNRTTKANVKVGSTIVFLKDVGKPLNFEGLDYSQSAFPSRFYSRPRSHYSSHSYSSQWLRAVNPATPVMNIHNWQISRWENPPGCVSARPKETHPKSVCHEDGSHMYKDWRRRVVSVRKINE